MSAYAFESFARLCGACYDELGCGLSGNFRRLAAYAGEQPQLFAGLLVAAQQHLRLDDWGLEGHLGLDVVSVLRLALVPLPRADHEDEDIALIARMAGCDTAVLRRLLLMIPEDQPEDA